MKKKEDFTTNKPESPLVFKKLYKIETLNAIREIMHNEWDAPGRTVVVVLTAKDHRIGFCHILPIKNPDTKRLDIFLGVPDGFEDRWKEEDIEKIDRVAMTTGKPYTTSSVSFKK